MTVFVDTSALFALADPRDPFHDVAYAAVRTMIDAATKFFTSNYVVVEAMALARNRLGPEGAATIHGTTLRGIEIAWVDANVHEAAVRAFLERTSRPSLVDHVSFELMRSLGIRRAFAFDADFARAGFEVLPA